MSSAARTLTRNARRDAVRRGKATALLRGRAARRPRPPASGLNPARYDPSRTGALRVKAGAAVRARYDRLRTELYRRVVLEDALGLGDEPPAWFRAAHDEETVWNYDPNQPRDKEGQWSRQSAPKDRAEADRRFTETTPHALETHEHDALTEVTTAKLPGGRFIEASVHENYGHFAVKIDFGVSGRSEVSVGEKLDRESVGMLRKVIQAVKVYHAAGFRIKVVPSDNRRAAVYDSYLKKLGLTKLHEGQGSSIWNFDAGQRRDERGRWAAVGGRALSALQRAGAHVGHLEHSAKSYVTDRLEAGVSRLPAGLQHAVRATVHVGRVGTRAAFVTWSAGQALAERVSRERGATHEQSRRLRGVLSALDLATFKPVSLGLAATGVSAATLGLAGFVPPATAAYLAYSTARDPVATWRAAKGLVRDAAYRFGVTLAGGTVRNANDAAWNVGEPNCGTGAGGFKPGNECARGDKPIIAVTEDSNALGSYRSEFHVEGRKYRFIAERGSKHLKEPWEVVFTDKGNDVKMTGDVGHGAVAVMRAVGAALDKFVGDKKPFKFYFTADTREASRVKLYDRVAGLIASRHGYSFAREHFVNDAVYRFERLSDGPAKNAQGADWYDEWDSPTTNSVPTLVADAADYLARYDTDLAFAVLLAAVEATGDLRTALPLAAEAVRDEGTVNTGTANAEGENCGTGAGGFKPGNTCAKGTAGLNDPTVPPLMFGAHEHPVDLPVADGVKAPRRCGFGECTALALKGGAKGEEVWVGTAVRKDKVEEARGYWSGTIGKFPGTRLGTEAFAHAWNVKDGKIVDRALGSDGARDHVYFGFRVPPSVAKTLKTDKELTDWHMANRGHSPDAEWFAKHSPTGNDDPTFNAGMWDLLPTADRLRAFGGWLKDTAADLWRGLEETLRGITELAIRKGAGRSFDEARAAHFLDPNFRSGAREQFIDGVLRDGDNRERFDVLKKRIHDEAVNHRDSVVEKVERNISDAVVQDRTPAEAWREITTIIDRERDSATTTVHDEVVRGHAEGQVAGFEEAGVTELFPLMEWTVHPEASKSGVCPRCRALKGTVWTISDARGKIPLHRNCRCTWTARAPESLPNARAPSPAPTYYAPGAGAKFAGNADAPGNCGTGAGGFRPGNTCAAGGSGPHPGGVEGALREIEPQLVGLKKERGVFLSPDGRVVQDKSGKRSVVRFDDADPWVPEVKGGVFTHSHGDSLLGFSPDDIYSAAAFGVRQVRAVGPKFTFVATTPESGWPAEKVLRKELKQSAHYQWEIDTGLVHADTGLRTGKHAVRPFNEEYRAFFRDKLTKLGIVYEEIPHEVRNAQARDALGRFAGLSADAAAYAATAWHNGGAGRKSAVDLPPAGRERLARSYAGAVLSAERSGKHDVAHELVRAAPALLPGARPLSAAGAVEPYDGARHEGALAGHRGDVRVTRPGLEFPSAALRGRHAVVIRARAEPVGTTNEKAGGANCGVGSGGFQRGNVCARGDDGGGPGPKTVGRAGSAVGTSAERAASLKVALAKIDAVPVPPAERVRKMRDALKVAREGKGRPGGDARGSSSDRKARARNLFREFGGEDRGYVVCPWTGIKMHWSSDPVENPRGYPKFEQGKIFVACQGGGYQLPNLIPESFAANRSRNDKRLRRENARGC